MKDLIIPQLLKMISIKRKIIFSFSTSFCNPSKNLMMALYRFYNFFLKWCEKELDTNFVLSNASNGDH